MPSSLYNPVPLKAPPVPEGAQVLTREELVGKQMNAIQKWEPKLQMWPFIHGHAMMGALSGCVGLFTTLHFRHKFFLGQFGRFSAAAPSILIPLATTTLIHSTRITKPLLEGQLDCTLCAEIRGGTMQFLTGFVQPTALGFLATMALAQGKRSTLMPHPVFAFKDFCGYVGSICPPLYRRYMFMLAGVNIGLGIFVTYHETERVQLVQDKLNIRKITRERSSGEVSSE